MEVAAHALPPLTPLCTSCRTREATLLFKSVGSVPNTNEAIGANPPFTTGVTNQSTVVRNVTHLYRYDIFLEEFRVFLRMVLNKGLQCEIVMGSWTNVQLFGEIALRDGWNLIFRQLNPRSTP